MATESRPASDPERAAQWTFYAIVATTVQGGHTLAEFGPQPTALDALRLAVHAVNHTAYSVLEQGIAGDPRADAGLVERLPITDFTITRQHSGTNEPDGRWVLNGGRHHYHPVPAAA